MLFVIGRWQAALFGFAAIGNALIGSLQEFRAKAALDKLALLNASTARVRRDGAEAEIPPGDVVLGDILVLRAGDQLPADAQVVGADAYANAFAGEAKRFSLVGSELRDSINRVLGWVGWAIGPVGLLVLNAQMQVLGGWRQAWRTGTWVDALTATIASVTAMIPLGLAFTTSIAFAVGAARLAAGARQRTARRRGARPGRRHLPRQDGHPHRGRHRLRRRVRPGSGTGLAAHARLVRHGTGCQRHRPHARRALRG